MYVQYSHLLPSFLRCPIIAVGARVAVQEIRQEGVNLKLCQKCADIIERAKRPDFAVVITKVVTTANRMNRVLKFIDNYIVRG